MRVIIIGKTGQLGQELEAVFSSGKHEVYAFSRKELEVTNAKKIKKVFNQIKPDVLINASAYHVVAECDKNPEEAFKINAVAVKNLAEICQELDAQFIHYNTDYIFDGKKGSLYKETDAPAPLQVYGISKYAGELLALNYCDKSIIIRTCGVYGKRTGSKAKGGNFILTILKQIKDVAKLEVASEQVVSPTYAADLAFATLELLKKGVDKGAYHLVNEGYCSWAEFASEIAKQSGSKTKIVPVDRKGQSGGARRPLFSALSNTKAKKIGIILPTWQDALRRYIEFLKQ